MSEPDQRPGPSIPLAEILPAVQRASGRSAAAVHQDMKRGLNSLATIASIAPFVGAFGTIFCILDSFPVFVGDITEARPIVTGLLSQACIPTATGLLAGVTALFSYKYLAGRLQDFDHEMEIASLELVNHLVRPATSAR